MGRRKLLAEEWTKQPPDLSFKNRRIENNDGSWNTEEVLFCRFCGFENDLKSRPSDKINAHLKTPKHQKLKDAELKRRQYSRQLTLAKTCSRLKQKDKQKEGIIHDFVRASCYGAISLQKADSNLGKFIRKYIPAAKNSPTAVYLKDKYL